MIRGTFRWLGRGIVATGVGTAALLAPPIEKVPGPLLHARVTCEGLVRMCRCVGVGLQAIYAFSWALPKDATPEEWDAAHQRMAERLTRLAEVNGGMYIKSGQQFAAMNHLLPRTYCRVMNKLHDSVTKRPIGEIYAVLEAELGRPVREVFSEFDDNAIAAASLAQVHRARLRSSGAPVAVKVQYIDIHQRYDGDLAVIKLMLRIGGTLFPGFDFGRLVEQSDRTLRGELDFAQEAANLRRCDADLRAEFGGAVVCPHVFSEVSTKRVLVTEFIEGVRADDVPGMIKRGIDPRDVGTLLSDAFAFQLFKSGFVHGDPHPGNLLVRPRPSSGAWFGSSTGGGGGGGGSGAALSGGDDATPAKRVAPQCVLLDLGLAFELTPEERKKLAEIWTCTVTRDIPGLRAVMRSLGLYDGDPEFRIFGSVWLQYPFDFFDPGARTASLDAVAAMRESTAKVMPVVTSMLEHLPVTYAMALRNIQTYRSVHKRMGNPVSRGGRMLRYSHVASGRSGWLQLQLALASMWFADLVGSVQLAIIAFFYPKIEELLDDELVIG
jgi:aarF domain-containing kinase